MEYIFYIENPNPKELAYIISIDDPEVYKDSEFVESGHGLYKFEKGLEVIKQNGNIVSGTISSKEHSQDMVQALLKGGLSKEQISPVLIFD